jgi:glycosyltransferase involved in cell wall biosynthesis
VSERPLLFVVSGVLPFPPAAGQNQRVRLKLEALRAHFRLGFLTFAPADRIAEVERRLRDWVDVPVVLPSEVHKSAGSRLWHHLRGLLWRLPRGLKLSNYIVGEVELSPRRVLDPLLAHKPDLVLFEYWHTWQVAAQLKKHGITTALDLHDLLWQGRSRDLAETRWLPRPLAQRVTSLYRKREEAAWGQYHILITISAGEDEYVRQRAAPTQSVFLAPMGVDTTYWSYQWQPVDPPRVMYYGGLASSHNQRDARICVDEIMPLIWQQRPEVELWIVGSNPPDSLLNATAGEPRITVTGFLEDPRSTLASASLVLCPWTGTYGFRSRIVEVLGLGIPVVCSQDAVAGMQLLPGGFVPRETAEDMAEEAIRLLSPSGFVLEASIAARSAAEALSIGSTYEQLAVWLSGTARSGGQPQGQHSEKASQPYRPPA